MTISHDSFLTTSSKGLRHDILPMRLYHKAKKLGVWDPQSIDFSQDIADWQQLKDTEKESLLQLTALFQAGEEGVTLDLLPLVMVIAREGRLEEEMFLTTFLWEEAKHTEFFRRFLDEVVQEKNDLHHYHTASFRELFYKTLPQNMHALLSDQSPEAQVKASITYNLVIEGVLAETGYHAYYNMLDRNQIMTGLKQGISLLKRDESRHLAYGVFLISRLVAENPSLWPTVEHYMNAVLIPALGVVNEIFEGYEELEEMPFGQTPEEYLNYATMQFGKRYQRIQRAQEQNVEELYHTDDIE